jgi:PAS domain S-box-containing protein
MHRKVPLVIEDEATERLLARVVRQTRNAVVITDALGDIVWVNAGFTRTSGYTLEEVIGRTPGQVLQGPATNGADLARIRNAMAARQAVNFELVNYHKDGTPYWIGMKIEPMIGEFGRAEGFMAIQDDITDQGLRRNQLETLNMRFARATRGAHLGVFERTANDGKIWWNDVMYELVGQDPETFEPTKDSIESIVHAEDRAQIFGQAADINATKVRFRILCPDGSTRHLERITGARQNADENLFGIALDVTDRVQAEQRERLLREQLRIALQRAAVAEAANGS